MNYWTTADGKKLKYKDLSDDHLKNILKDGYRNPHIRKEAKRRGFKVPERPIEKLTPNELAMWLESFASCAIEGNVLGEEMSRLWDENRPMFLLELNRLLELDQSRKEK